jgi:hypothetical protein
MAIISSRTPEGQPACCPVCGHAARIEPSTFPTNDAPCPSCGHLLWMNDTFETVVFSETSTNHTNSRCVTHVPTGNDDPWRIPLPPVLPRARLQLHEIVDQEEFRILIG